MAYDAFISYSHTADGRLAPAVQSGLQRLARPWYRTRALRVFRDETGLAVNPHLWASIESALDESEYFVLLASPEAAESPWVAREIEHWIATKPVEHILPVLTDGDLVWDPATGAYDAGRSTALPAVLATAYAAEPRHLDMRWARTEAQLDLRHADFRAAIAGLAAPIHGVSRDELEGEDVAQHRRTMRIAWGAAALLLFVTIAAVVSSFFAVSYASTARANERRAIAERARARQNAAEAKHQRTLAIDNASAAHSAQDEAESNANEAAQNASEAQVQRALAEANATKSAQNAAEAQANGEEAEQQSIVAQQNAARASANAARASRNAEAAAASAAEAGKAADLAAAQRTLAQRSAATARAQRAQAVASAIVARSRQLAASALNTFATDPQRALIMSAQGNTFQSNSQAQDSLLRTLQRQPRGLRGYLSADRDIGPVAGVVASPDGRRLVTIGASGRIALRDLVTGDRLPAPPAPVVPSGQFAGVAFSPDNNWLLLQTSGSIEIWDIAAARTVAVIPAPFGHVMGATFSRDRRLLAVAAVDGVRLYAVPTGSTAVSVAPAPSAVRSPIALPPMFGPYALALSADNGMVAVSGIVGLDLRAQVLVFDTTSGLPVASLAAETGGCVCLGQRWTVDLAFGIEGGVETLTLVPSHSTDSVLISWHVGTWQRLRDVPIPSSIRDSGEAVVAVNADRSLVATAPSDDGLGRIRDLVTGELVAAPFDARLPFCEMCNDGFVAVGMVAFGPSNTLIIAGSDNLVRWFDPNNDEPLLTRIPLDHAPAVASSTAISADGRVAASLIQGSGLLRVFDAQDGHILARIAAPIAGVSTVELSPDGSRVAAYSEVQQGSSSQVVLSVWQVDSARMLWQQPTEFASAFGLSFDPSGQMLAVTATPERFSLEAEVLVLVDAATGDRISTSPPIGYGYGQPNFSADGERVVLGNLVPNGSPVIVYDVAERRVVRELSGTRFDSVAGVVFSANGRTAVAYPLSGGRIMVLDPDTFTIRHDFRISFNIMDIAISSDGARIATISFEGALQMFAADTGEPTGDPLTLRSTPGFGRLGLAFTGSPSAIVAFSSSEVSLELVLVDADPDSWSERACTVAGRNLTRQEWTALLGQDVPYETTCPRFPEGT